MDNTLKLPVGIENFEDIRKLGFYYIDKTKLIEQLLDNWGKVTLFTRPRRFGKTLNMSMLRAFFEIGTDPTLFDGTNLSMVAPFNEKKPVPSCRNADGPYNDKQFVLTVDGFIVSDNVTVSGSDVYDLGFKYSDHNPVYMTFKLNG